MSCLLGAFSVKAQYFNSETTTLYQTALENNDTLQIFKIKQQITQVDMQTVRYKYLPKITLDASYTHLNDAIEFPENLQQLLIGTQKLLIKEAMGIPFNTALPSTVPLQPVTPIQEQDILKTTLTGQWLLFSGLKVNYGLKAYRHQQKSIDYLAEKESNKIKLEVSDTYDKLALIYESDAIIKSSERVLDEQAKFVNAAIQNGLATPLDRKKLELAQQKLEIKKLENASAKKILVDKLHQLTLISVEELTLLHPEIIPAVFDVATIPSERSEIKALDEGIEARKYKEKAEWAEYVPKVAAFGKYELRENDLSLFDPKWAVGVKLQWNVFDGLDARNNARKESLERQLLEYQKHSVKNLIELGYAKAKQDYILATDKVTLKEKEVKLAEDTYDFVAKQYKNGLIGITELLNALNDVEKSRFEQKQAVYDQRRAALKAADISGITIQ